MGILLEDRSAIRATEIPALVHQQPVDTRSGEVGAEGVVRHGSKKDLHRPWLRGRIARPHTGDHRVDHGLGEAVGQWLV
jgi:hypothetical protein